MCGGVQFNGVLLALTAVLLGLADVLRRKVFIETLSFL